MGAILVTFATKHGSTAEVAEAVAEVLREGGHDVDLKRAGAVRKLSGYEAVVFGFPLYMARPIREGRAFLRRHRRELAKKPLAMFVLGPLDPEGKDRPGAQKQLDGVLAKRPYLRPTSVALFGGAIDPAKLRFPTSKMPAADARDWEAIRAWAAEVAAHLGGPVRATA